MEKQRVGWWPFLATLMVGLLSAGACSDDGGIKVVECRGATKCGEVCRNLQADPENCGACGTVCAEGEVCAQGQCAVSCTGGTTSCDGGCFNINNDPNNCGACGNVCDADLVCSSGQCVPGCGGGTVISVGSSNQRMAPAARMPMVAFERAGTAKAKSPRPSLRV